MTRYQFLGTKSNLRAFFASFEGKYAMSYFSSCQGKKGSVIFMDIEGEHAIFFDESAKLPSPVKRVARALRLTSTVVIP